MIAFRCEGDPCRLAGVLGAALDAPGRYIDFHDEHCKHVVYPDGHILSFERGDIGGREAAAVHGRGRGIPEGQLDWSD